MTVLTHNTEPTPETPEDLASMTPKDRFLRLVAGNLEIAYAKYAARVEQEGDIEDMRKMIAQGIETVQWKVETKKDPNDNLPMFNIIVNGGGVTVQQVSQEPTPVPLTVDMEDLPTLSLSSRKAHWDTTADALNDSLGDLDA